MGLGYNLLIEYVSGMSTALGFIPSTEGKKKDGGAHK